MSKKNIIAQFKNMQATFKFKTKTVIEYYGIDNTVETTEKIKEWLELNKIWSIENNSQWRQYRINKNMIINFYE